MANPTSFRIDDETKRQLEQLAAWYGAKNATAVFSRVVQQSHAIEAARRVMTDSEFLGFLAEMFLAEGS